MFNIMNMLVNNLLANKLNSMPQYQQYVQSFNQMMNGKNDQQQMQTILNMAQSRGIDIHAPIITEQQAQQLGLNIPRKG